MKSLTQCGFCFVLGPLILVRWGLRRSLDVLIPLAVAEVLDRVDLTALVTEHVDLDEIIRDVALPEIIRESTGVMMSDSVWRVRTRGVAADDAVARVRNRLSRPTKGGSANS